MFFRTLSIAVGLMCFIAGTLHSETPQKGKVYPLKNTELKTEGLRFAQPAPFNASVSQHIAGKPVFAPKSNNFVDVAKRFVEYSLQPRLFENYKYFTRNFIGYFIL